MSLTALYHLCSIGIYYNVYRFKNNETIRNVNSQRGVAVKHTEN